MIKFFKWEKSRVYLGAIVVAPREEIAEENGLALFRSLDYEEEIRRFIQDALGLPQLSTRDEVRESDLALELAVKVQGGMLGNFSAFNFDMPLMWRPRVRIKSRMYHVRNDETKANFDHTEKMPWRVFFLSAFRWKSFFGFSPISSAQDMERLLLLCCVRLISRMRLVL